MMNEGNLRILHANEGTWVFIVVLVIVSLFYVLERPANLKTVHNGITHEDIREEIQLYLQSQQRQPLRLDVTSDKIFTEESMKEEPINFSGPKKVIVMTYMRSGSTFLGEFFDQNPYAFYWFEPIDGILSNLYGTRLGWIPIDITQFISGTDRVPPDYEREAIADGATNLLNCDLDEVPLETTVHDNVIKRLEKTSPKYLECIFNSNKMRGRINQCKVMLKYQCLNFLYGNHLYKCHDRLHGGLEEEYELQLKRMEEYIQTHPKLIFSSDTTIEQFKTELSKVDNETLKYFSLDEKVIESFYDHNVCLREIQTIYDKCSPNLIYSCTKAKVRVLKTIRLTMSNVADIIEKDPSIRIIHLLRDPRATAHSRLKATLISAYTNRISDSNIENKMRYEATMICHKFRKDLATRKSLEKKYPKNFLQIQYENVARSTKEEYLKIYNFLDLKPSPEVESWINKNTNAAKDNYGFGTQRKNSTETAFKWETDIQYRTVKLINEECMDILSLLGVN